MGRECAARRPLSNYRHSDDLLKAQIPPLVSSGSSDGDAWRIQTVFSSEGTNPALSRDGAAAADGRQPALCRGPHDLVRRGSRDAESEDGGEPATVRRGALLRRYARACRTDF